MSEKGIDLIKWLASQGIQAQDGPSKGIISLNVPREQFIFVIQSLHREGFDYLATITCVDLQNQHCELIYNVYSFDLNMRLFVRVVVGYEEKMPTVLHLWPNARFYEREIYEMFGIGFTGNPDYAKPFILEGNDPIEVKFPMRKSFDSIEFSQTNYGDRDYGSKKS